MGLSTFYREAVPGRAGRFDTTHWSLVLAAGRGEPEKAREALQQLCEAYWYPLYVFARKQGHDPAESEDLTQDFFASLLRRRDLSQVCPERGRFRSILLRSLKHLLINEHHRRKTVKRGGRTDLLSLDAVEAEQRYRCEPAQRWTPESLFERRWALTVLDRATERIRDEYARSERADLFETLKEFLSVPKPLAHAAIASRNEISISAVGVAIHRLRRRYAEILREEISHTVGKPGDIEDEIYHLIAAA